MKIAMGVLAVLAVVGGVVNIPHVLEPLHKFLEPTFADSRALRGARAVRQAVVLGMAVGSLLGLLGIFIA